MHLLGSRNQCKFYGNPCDYIFFIRAINLKYGSNISMSTDLNPVDCGSDLHVLHLLRTYTDDILPGPWSEMLGIQCYFENMMVVMVKIICFLTILMLLIGFSFPLWRYFKDMVNIKVVPPAEFKQLLSTSQDTECLEKTDINQMPFIEPVKQIEIKPVVMEKIDEVNENVYTELQLVDEEKYYQNEEGDYLPMIQNAALGNEDGRLVEISEPLIRPKAPDVNYLQMNNFSDQNRDSNQVRSVTTI